MKSIETGIEIDAPAVRVSEVFSDFERYPDWKMVGASTRSGFEAMKAALKLGVEGPPPDGDPMFDCPNPEHR